jgi:hypothetical protein
VARRNAAKEETPVLDRELRRIASDLCCGGRKKERAYLGADKPEGTAGLEDRIAP